MVPPTIAMCCMYYLGIGAEAPAVIRPSWIRRPWQGALPSPNINVLV